MPTEKIRKTTKLSTDFLIVDTLLGNKRVKVRKTKRKKKRRKKRR